MARRAVKKGRLIICVSCGKKSKRYPKSAKCRKCMSAVRYAWLKKRDYTARAFEMIKEWHGDDLKISRWQQIRDEIGSGRRGMALDKIDDSRPYELGNIRWVEIREKRFKSKQTVLSKEVLNKIHKLLSLGARKTDLSLRYNISRELVVYHARSIQTRRPGDNNPD